VFALLAVIVECSMTVVGAVLLAWIAEPVAEPLPLSVLLRTVRVPPSLRMPPPPCVEPAWLFATSDCSTVSPPRDEL
jgi:hypothetical protein